MNAAYLTEENIQRFIETALAEDVGEGDHSALGAVPANRHSEAQLLIKDDGILAGIALAQKIFQAVDAALVVDIKITDGQAVRKGDKAFVISGNARSILTSERLVLNCMQRMSGIATYTHRLQSMISHTKARVLDTRKTTPNFRLPEKWAVHIGGGQNHRFALYDMIMLKDNHIDFAGGITKAITHTQSYLQNIGKKLLIEIETRTLKEVEEILKVGKVDIIMLDNMSVSTMKEAIQMINGKYKTEASGNINENTITAVAECGVDYISVGALTHSVKSLDMSLKALKV